MVARQSVTAVLIGNANAMTAELLVAALNRQSRFRVVAVATTVNEVLEVVQSGHVDVALISATLADGPLGGFVAVRKMRACCPGLKSVMLLDSPSGNLAVDAFRAGAKGVFCPSESNLKMLYRCVDRVHSGQIWAKSSELAHVMEAFTQLAPLRVVNADGLKLLTKREEDVVRLLAEGLQNREIARELNLSEHTIKNYLFRIFDKLGVSSRVELVLYAVSNTNRVPIAAVEEREEESDAPEQLSTGTDLA